MYQKAIDKLKAEMTAGNNNPYIQVVGGFLLQQLEASPAVAEKIMDKDKTIIKSLDAMKKAAEKKKVGNCAVLTDQEGFDIVLKYFGIDAAASTPTPAAAPQVAEHEATLASKGIDLSLDDWY